MNLQPADSRWATGCGLLGLLVLASVCPASALAAGGRPCAPEDDGELWGGVAVSRGSIGTIAVWTTRTVLVSRDDGVTFAPLTAADGSVRAVAVGNAGTVFVVRETGEQAGVLEVFGVDRAAIRRPIPAGVVSGLGVGGGWLVLAQSGQLLATRDLGKSWQRLAFAPGYWNALFVAGDGALEVLAAEVNTCGSGDRLEGLKRVRGRAGETLQDLPFRSAASGPGRLTPTARRFAYAQTIDGIVAFDQNGTRSAVWQRPNDFAVPWPQFSVVQHERRSVASYGRYLIELDGRRAQVLDEDAPAGFVATALDRRGQVFGHAGERLLRWAPKIGFTPLRARLCPGTSGGN